MSCKTESTTIGEHEYSVTQWPAERAMLTKFKLVKILGASLAMIAGALSGNDKEDKQAEAFSEALDLMFKASSPEEMVALVKSSVVGVSCDGMRITESRFEELFSGDGLLDAYKVFAFVLKVNYGNFIQGRLGEKIAHQVSKVI